MKLTSLKHPTAYAGQTVNFPVIGNATFEKDGTLEVEDDKVEEFVELTYPSFAFELPETEEDEELINGEYPKVKAGTVVFVSGSEVVVEKKKPGRKPKSEEQKALEAFEKEKAEIKATLKPLTFQELVDLAKDTDLPKESLAGMSDSKLRSELLKRLMNKK